MTDSVPRPVAGLLRSTIGVLAAASLLLAVAAGAAPPRYEIQTLDLARLGAADVPLLYCCSINNHGEALGTLVRSGADGHAEVWKWDTLADTVEFLPFQVSVGLAPRINDAGQVVGRLPGGFEAFLWSESTGVVSLNAPGFSDSLVGALNDVGQVVVGRFNGFTPGLPREFVLRNADGSEILLAETELASSMSASDLNDHGVIVGGRDDFPGIAYVWDAATGFSPLLPPAGVGAAEALSVNGAGTIVGGFADGSGDLRVAVWPDRDAVPFDLPCISSGGPDAPGRRECRPIEITNRGEIFGFTLDDESEELLVWADGVPYLTGELLDDPDVLGGCGTFGVNDLGQTAGPAAFPDPEGGPLPIILPCVATPVPTVTLLSPLPDAVIQAGEVLVSGLATEEFQVAGVAVNGIEATLVSTGNPNDSVEVSFEVLVPLAPGVNEIIVAARDPEGFTDELALTVTSEAAEPPRRCDVTGDGVVDSADVDAIFAARGETASGPADARDVNGDGFVTINDARECVLACDLPECETPAPAPACGLLGVELLLPLAWLRRRRSRTANDTTKGETR